MSKSDLLPIEKNVKHALEQTFPAAQNIRLVIGVSGGADSMSLLHLLHMFGVDLYVVHVNYQKRGEASDQDARLVEKKAGSLGIDIETVTVEPNEAEGQNFQQWARGVRYNAFQIKAENVSADGIATAHHKDDQVETILQKMFRGAGLASWSAMQVWDGQFFRPLLNISRDEIEQYCHEKSIDFRDDETNFDSDFARNFLRNEWLPQLEEHFPGWETNVLRIADQADIFGESLRYILKSVNDGKDRLNRDAFLQLDLRLQKSVLLYYLQQVNSGQDISRDALKELRKLPDLQTGKSIQLTPNMELMRDRDFLKLVVNTGDSESFLTLEKAVLDRKNVSFNGVEFALESYENPDFSQHLYLDCETASWPLCIRRWRPGDRFQPFGMEGHQTVADHLTNRKVSAAEKENALVIESFEETICAVIFPPIENRVPPGTISEQAKCNESTRICLTIKGFQN